ncbi:hypothetical protein [Aquimarina sediminis]|uniref:hypothetical protein n=1 Tax=Aquimarina sediminis TaxID=2070536 RepID=UPI000FFEFEEF|nr:hypothetical protein [Aquimarina sediminis]
MINLKTTSITISLLLLLIMHIQCASSQQIDKKSPIEIKNTYFQEWIAGVEGGGSGFMIYLEVDAVSDVKLEYAYFRGKKIKLGHKTNELVYVGHYTKATKPRDLIMSDDPKEEFKNQLPEIEEKIPFELADNECMISYMNNGKQGFFKLENIPEKELQAYPTRKKQ